MNEERNKKIIVVFLTIGILLFGLSVECSHAQATWEQMAPSNSPPGRLGHKMAYDSVRNVVILFGGHRGVGCGNNIYLNDTWKYDGSNWSQLTPGTAPSVRTDHDFVYDSNRNVIVLFGGWNGTNRMNDTWEYDGSDWTPKSPAHQPPVRQDHILTYDSGRGVAVLFGGFNGSPLNDTWEYNGTDWIQKNPAHRPPARYAHSMAYDRAHGQVVLFGGSDGSSTLNDTWVWDGNDWNQANPATSPPSRSSQAMAYDSSRHVIVLFGGWSSPYKDDTWEWNGLNWTQVAPVNKPIRRYGHDLVFDATRGNILLFGGLYYDGGCNYLDDTWIYHPPNQAPVADAGPNVTINSEEQSLTVISGTATDPDGDAMTYQWLEGTNPFTSWQAVEPGGAAPLDLSDVSQFSIGEHTLTLKVRDATLEHADSMILTVENSAPHPAPTGGGVYEIATPVVLGGQVSDFDGDLLEYEWLNVGQELCSGEVQPPSGGSPANLPDCTISSSDLGLGSHTLTLRVDDGVNTPVTSDVTVQVVDTGAPTLAPEPNKTLLWPPNHRMINITIRANASDASGGPVTLAATVRSNEPVEGLGDGDTSPDWTEPVINQETGIISLQLRAERSGRGEGRIYTITITVRDESGNSSQAEVEIIVPHDRGR